ncbi:hypothetical protein [Crocosphaera sp. XPORK-15E]|uniref:hypothetical protein n=1 Tax=Crocosphaera sp. XPORK-15E TaxID=3110247 RepID=UPI002B20DFB8|nr:hypothetical protein [Crocosphaera sp. XPORK-15E]MEA5532692.1 hypothetical protein [Crocosphaera sp. XPORK-15E]
MKTQLKPLGLGLLGTSIGMGIALSLAPMTSVYAGTLNQNILDNTGQTVGNINFSWDDSQVQNNLLKTFGDLTSFSFTDSGNNTYNLNFSETASIQKFEYNLETGGLKATAYNLGQNTSTMRDGFWFDSVNHKFYSQFKNSSAFIGAFSMTNVLPISPPGPAGDPPGPTVDPTGDPTVGPTVDPTADPTSIPEGSLVAALLTVAGLIISIPKKG